MFGYQEDLSYEGNYKEANAAETLNSVAAVTRAITQPATEAYKAHLRTEIERERIRAGLPPMVVVVPPQQQPKTISPLALAIGLFIVYLTFR